jgi:transposase-like protein
MAGYTKRGGNYSPKKSLWAKIERVAGVDQIYFKIKGKKVCLNIAVSPQGDVLSLELLSEESSQSYASIFNQLKRAYGLEVIVTDDHKLYPEALEKMEEPLPRQLCLFHLKRNVAKWLRKLDLSEEEEERIKRLLSPPFVPLTNNHTERAMIGSKLRSRTTRGLKSEQGCLNFFGLNCYIHNEMSEGLLSLA